MSKETVDLSVQIVRFLLDHQPPIVSCDFVDADGRHHAFTGKLWMFFDGNLDAHSEYPQPGAVRCAVLNRWRDTHGRELVRINTADPDLIESSDGVSEFVVLQTQVSAYPGQAG
jgi:hypothetical protein